HRRTHAQLATSDGKTETRSCWSPCHWLIFRTPVQTLRNAGRSTPRLPRSEEHTSELQSRENLVCRLLLEKKDISPHRENDTLLIWCAHQISILSSLTYMQFRVVFPLISDSAATSSEGASSASGLYRAGMH